METQEIHGTNIFINQEPLHVGQTDDFVDISSASVKTPLIRSIRDVSVSDPQIAFIPGIPRWTIWGRLGVVACILSMIIHLFALFSSIWAGLVITTIFCIICLFETTFCLYCIYTHTEDVRIWKQTSYTKKRKALNKTLWGILVIAAASLIYLNALASIYCFMMGYNANVYRAPGKMYELEDGRKLHMHCQGKGDTVVVFIHDWRGQGLDWARVQPKVANYTTSCTIDRTGYGWSDFCYGCGRTSQQESDDMDSLFKAANMQNNTFVLVAHHYASYIMGVFINQHPEYKIEGAVCIDCVYYGDSPPENAPKRQFWHAYVNLLPSGLCAALGANGWFPELNRYLPLPEAVHQAYLVNNLRLSYAEAVIGERDYRDTSMMQATQAGSLGYMPIRVILSSFSANNTDFAKISSRAVTISYPAAPENMFFTASYAGVVAQQIYQLVISF